MILRRILGVLPLFWLVLFGTAEADGWGYLPVIFIPDLRACRPPFHDDLVATIYSYQVPIMISNEAFSGEIVWAYADGCVRPPENWSPGMPIPPFLREGKTWSSLLINDVIGQDLWTASFPPDESVRQLFSGDDFSLFGASKIYVPSFEALDGDRLPASLIRAPNQVITGVSPNMAATLREAGMIVEDGRVWVEYSDNAKAREGRNLKPFKAIHRWAPAYSLLCEPGTRQRRTGNNPDLARVLMVRSPAFPWELAKDFDCRSSSDKDESGLRKWGGGIVVLHLFPNLELAPLEVTAQDGFVNVGVRLKNQSPVAGPVHVYYRWESTGAWKRYEQTLTVKPYQNTARGEAVEPFVMRLPGPEKPDKLTVLVWPDPGTGLTTNHPDLGGATSAVLSESGGLDRLFEAHTRELTLRDNMQSAAVQPVFCGDLTVSVNAPARAPDEGFTFTVTATRYGCESLQNVIIDATVNGITQRQRVAFRGQTAVATFESGPQYGESRAWIRVVVDPDNLVRESNEANNWAERSVVLEETWLDEIVCPYDEPPEKCFRSRLYE